MSADRLDDIAPRHEPVDVSKAMREATAAGRASEPPRVTRPADAHQVERIAKRRSAAADAAD